MYINIAWEDASREVMSTSGTSRGAREGGLEHGHSSVRVHERLYKTACVAIFCPAGVCIICVVAARANQFCVFPPMLVGRLLPWVPFNILHTSCAIASGASHQGYSFLAFDTYIGKF